MPLPLPLPVPLPLLLPLPVPATLDCSKMPDMLAGSGWQKWQQQQLQCNTRAHTYTANTQVIIFTEKARKRERGRGVN